MHDQDIFYWPAARLVKAIKQRQLSAVEVMQAHLDRLDKINPLLNGLVQQVPREICLQQALKADQDLSKGHVRGKLHGLPFTVKDIHIVKGLVSCLGCTALKDQVAQEDSTVVSRLKREGAIVLGITNVPEFLCAYETDNLVYGRTNNPYDLSKTCGGSSGGCAALVASGCSPLSIGTDAGGSIRWPAHCTGIAAHKPTIGLVPRTGSPMGNAKGLLAQFTTSGPLTRTIEDLILVLPILAGPDELDPHVPPVHLKDIQSVDLSSLRIAYFIEDEITKPSLETIESIHHIVKEIRPSVAKIEHISLPFVKDAYRLLWEHFYLGGDQGNGMKNLLQKLGVTDPSPLMQSFLQQTEKSLLSVTQFRQLFRKIDTYRIHMLEALKNYDILLSPVATTPAKPHGTTFEESQDMTACMIHSLTGWPVTIVRCGYSKEQLPIGLQVAAKPWNDHLCLALAKHIESTSGGWRPPHL